MVGGRTLDPLTAAFRPCLRANNILSSEQQQAFFFGRLTVVLQPAAGRRGGDGSGGPEREIQFYIFCTPPLDPIQNGSVQKCATRITHNLTTVCRQLLAFTEEERHRSNIRKPIQFDNTVHAFIRQCYSVHFIQHCSSMSLYSLSLKPDINIQTSNISK